MADDAPDAEHLAEARRRYAKFVARYRTDKRFREAVDKDPTAALAKAGIPVEKGTRVRLVTVDPDERILLIPTGTTDLEQLAAQGGTWGTVGTGGTAGTIDGSFFCIACFGTIGCSGLTFRTPDDPEPKEPEPKEPEEPEPAEPDDTGDSGDTGGR